jgi:hypothetical protein
MASLNQFIGPVYNDLEYDEDPHLRCLELTQHGWVLDQARSRPNYTKYYILCHMVLYVDMITFHM